MASTQTFVEFNGATPGTETAATTVNWKNIDDNTTTVYSAAPITAGTNSFIKYQSIKFGGTWNSLSGLTTKIDANSATGLSWVAGNTTTYVQPAVTASGDAAWSTTSLSHNLGTAASSASSVSLASTAAGYSSYVRSQLQTTSSAAPGDTATRTVTYTWTES